MNITKSGTLIIRQIEGVSSAKEAALEALNHRKERSAEPDLEFIQECENNTIFTLRTGQKTKQIGVISVDKVDKQTYLVVCA